MVKPTCSTVMPVAKRPIIINDIDNFIRIADKIDGARILVLDIESFHLVVACFGLFDQNISTDSILKDISLMSVACKWLGDNHIFYLDNRDEDNPRDDLAMITALHTILEHTDLFLAHNGARFDYPMITARMALLGMSPLPPIKQIDTLQLVRRSFKFTSNKLAYISSKFSAESKDTHSDYPGMQLWLACDRNELKAWNACRKYNCLDVTTLEDAYLKLRGWFGSVQNLGTYSKPQGDMHICPNCGGTNLVPVEDRQAHTNSGTYSLWHCDDCGAYPRGRKMLQPNKERQHILSK